ncbi:MAG: dephospho-CoA kinase, partial [Candidatus Omnitrophota bacterium]
KFKPPPGTKNGLDNRDHYSPDVPLTEERVFDLLRSILQKGAQQFEDGLILDFSPSGAETYPNLIRVLKQEGFSVSKVIYVKINKNKGKQRYVARGKRPGVTTNYEQQLAFEQRFEQRVRDHFNPFSLPIIRQARTDGRLLVINNDGTKEELAENVKRMVEGSFINERISVRKNDQAFADILLNGGQSVVAFPPSANELNADFPRLTEEMMESSPDIRELYIKISKLTGYSLEDLCLHDFQNQSQDFVLSNVAFFLYEVSLYKRIESWLGKEIHPKYFTGFSAGTWIALVAAKAITIEDAVKFMQKILPKIQESSSRYQLGRISIVKDADIAAVNDVLRRGDEGGIIKLSNDISPGYLSLRLMNTNPHRTLQEFVESVGREILKSHEERGHHPLVKTDLDGERNLRISPHHGLYDEVLEEARKLAEGMSIQSPRVPVISSSVPGKVIRTATDVLNEIIEGPSLPVYWSDTVHTYRNDASIKSVVIFTLGTILPKLNSELAPEILSLNIQSFSDMNQIKDSVMDEIIRLKQLQRVRIIGVTGPTAAGKSALMQYMQHKGASVIEVDDFFRQQLPQAIQNDLTNKFGPGVLNAQGGLNLSFFLEHNKADFIEVVHYLMPYFASMTLLKIREDLLSKEKDVFIEFAALRDLGIDKILDDIVLVQRGRAERLSWKLSKDKAKGRSEAEIRGVFELTESVQLTDSEYDTYATKRIINTGDKEQLYSQADDVLREDKVMKTNDKDSSMGGIDLTPANNVLQTQNDGQSIKFHLDPAMLNQLQNAPGFVPVIINIQPLNSLQKFLGVDVTHPTPV